ncbi:type IV secretion system protein, partial [Stenotrophomonas sp. C3(2023)]|uniref:type IV secretion system protein n=1 Tax=Stenotrophomonas sp. C3(2023) TaxID=3080277 RepID=UPI00293C7197
AVTAGSMLLLYEVAMMLFIAFGPVFIICLLFDQTRSLFQRWLLYGIGTMFSMAVLAFMVSIALDMVLRVTGVLWAVDGLGSVIPALAAKDGFTSQAMQQGGMGLILTTLILTVPPMAAMFFQGTLGSFMAYSQIGGGPAAVGPRGEALGSYVPARPGRKDDSVDTSDRTGQSRPMPIFRDSFHDASDAGRFGIAIRNGEDR